jgi:hypothetical protein
LIFTGLIALTIAFIFATGMVNVNVGGLNSVWASAKGATGRVEASRLTIRQRGGREGVVKTPEPS